MKNRTVIIQASSKSHGNTNIVANYILNHKMYDFVDLKDFDIGPFDYDNKNAGDDFLPLAQKLIKQYDTLIFATPIYWYTMSATLKVFFDRLSDLLIHKKELGRQLKGKNMALISCGSDAEIKSGFNMPFVESANYLGMYYLGDVHSWIENDAIPYQVKKKLDHFMVKISTMTELNN